MIEIKAALSQAFEQLETISSSARLDAEILLAHAIQKTRTYLYTHPDALLTDLEQQEFQTLIGQRLTGVPIAYLTGSREFWSLPLKVNENTLIPRPETELLVELTLTLLTDKPEAQLLDLGTGSGAIALACAYERPAWQIIACDYNALALKVAKENALRLGLTNICFCQSNWFDELDNQQHFDAIITNPPYIAPEDPHLLEGDLRFEPQLALVSEENGLQAIQHIIQHSLARLQPGGLLLVEHGFTQKTVIESMLNDYGYETVQCWQDWQGHDRISGGRRKKD